MEIRTNTTFVRSPGPVDASLPGETVILDPSTGAYFGLEGVGARIWELIESPSTFDSLVTVLADEYEVDRPTLESDVRALMYDLIEAGLAQPVAE